MITVAIIGASGWDAGTATIHLERVIYFLYPPTSPTVAEEGCKLVVTTKGNDR